MAGDLDIKFFPAQQIKNGYMGGGYITSGLLKTRFSIFQSGKTPEGFYVSLPSSKKPDGQWENHVEFKNKDSMQVVANHVAPQVSGLINGGAQATAAVANAPSQVQVQNQAGRVGTPF